MQARTARWLVIGAVAAVGAVALFVATALATDAPAFCNSCHEMKPYYASWSQGQHADEAACIECHVGPGYPARFAHKFVALGEVWSHFTGDTTFPRPTPPDVPDARCVRCHPDVPARVDGFPHAVHAEKGGCAQCHLTAGHAVTAAALRDAGVYSGVAVTRLSGPLATVGAGKANLPGHIEVACSGCHDMRATPCSVCHRPPAKHASGPCTDCHPQPGRSWTFRHTGDTGEHSYRDFPCAKCHPKNYTNAYCTCHKGRPPTD